MKVPDLLLPIGYVDRAPSLPRTMERHVSAGARGMREAANLVDMMGRGRGYKPNAPILIVGPDGRTPILLMAFGDVEVAELQDMAVDAIGHQDELAAAGQRGMDFDDLREKHGYVRRDNAGQAISDAISQRIAHHKANPVTDPFRQPKSAVPLKRQYSLGGLPKDGAS